MSTIGRNEELKRSEKIKRSREGKVSKQEEVLGWKMRRKEGFTPSPAASDPIAAREIVSAEVPPAAQLH